ncbi:MAG TPA: GtrA family protein [Candidatus Paceibacterota bacterium]|nr:GtrA family protein [Candidatus Paceibacterota bacterium]
MDVFNRKTAIQFRNFAVVGVISTICNYSIFFVLLRTANVQYLLSSAIGFIVGIFISYELNRRVSFESGGYRKRKEFMLYAAVCLFSLVLSLLTLRLLVEVFTMNVLLANVCAIGVSTITNFIGAKIVVFKAKEVF